MEINISPDAYELGRRAGIATAMHIREAIADKGSAAIVLATGASQFGTIEHLTLDKEINWSKVTMFHLDEYIGLPMTHPASFRRYLQERFVSKIPPLKAVYFINGEGNAVEECRRLSRAIEQQPIDVALVGIGENGHLAFNDPPADFDTEQPYIIVELDERCCKQQLGEGWFGTIAEVPRRAISMSVQHIMKAKQIIASVPDERKAVAVKNTVEQPVSNRYPASILQQHPACTLYLDKASAALLSTNSIA